MPIILSRKGGGAGGGGAPSGPAGGDLAGNYPNPTIAVGAVTATEVPFTPTGTIAATDTQAAIVEVASEVESFDHGRAVISGVTQYSIPGIAPQGDVSTFTKTSARAEYMPWLVNDEIVIDRLVVELTTGVAASTSRVALYRADTDWQPTSLVVDSGAFNTTAVEQGVISLTIADTTLSAGRYLAWGNSSTGNPIFRSIRGSLSKVIGFPVALGTNSHFTNIYVAQAYAAPPDPGDDWTTTTVGTQATFGFWVFCRIKTP